jgi:hypothetical protein
MSSANVTLGGLLLPAAALISASLTNPPPPESVFEIGLSSALRCGKALHDPLAIRFAPSKPMLAVVMHHTPLFGRSSVHLIVASLSGDTMRLLGDAPEPNLAGDRDIVWWSPDSEFVALAVYGWVPQGRPLPKNSIALFRADGGSKCEIGSKEPVSQVVGFVRGPLLAVSRPGTLDFFDMNCALIRSQPFYVSYSGVAVPPAGDYLAFLSDEAVITDARGEDPKSVKLDWSDGQHKPDIGNLVYKNVRGRYTESARVLCIASTYHTHCFDTDSARTTGKLPAGMKGRMSDASSTGTRIVYPRQEATAIGLVGLATGSVDSRLLGCSVWDYREGREVFHWTVPTFDKVGLPRIGTKGRPGAAFALSPAGDFLAVTRGASIWLHALPQD